MVPGIAIMWATQPDLDDYENFTALQNNLGSAGLIIAILSSALYMLLRDGLKGGQSFGKRWFGIAVVRIDTGEKCTIAKSMLRNVLWVLIVVFPYFVWILFPLEAIAEGVLVLTNPQGKRIGDLLAGTMVVGNRH